jgi:DNA polymerase-3 subunit beta
MQITYEAKSLQPVLNVAQSAARTRNALPILSCALVEPNPETGTMTLTVNNLEQAVTLTVPVLTDANRPFVLPVQSLARLNSLLSNTVTMTIQDERIHIRCAQAEYEIAAPERVDEYPPTRETPTLLTTIPTELLLGLFSYVNYAVAKENIRPALTGVRVILEDDMIAMAATDTHRLVFKYDYLPTSVAESCAMTVPAEAFALLQRVYTLGGNDQCEIYIGDECVAFQLPQGRVWTQLFTEQYPNWQRVIPEEARLTVYANRNILLERLRRISVADPESQKIYLNFTDTLTISARGDRFAKAEETMELVSPPKEPVEIAININYFTQAIKGFNGEEIALDLTEPLRPIKIYDADPSMHAAVIMPMVL